MKELQAKAHATKGQVEVDVEEIPEPYSSGNRGYISQNKHDTGWYFDNAASYHMTFDLADFQEAENHTRRQHPHDNTTLADGSSIESYSPTG